VLALLSDEANAGRPLILATAADELVARGVAQHLQLFSHVVASDGSVNCKGTRKLEAIKKLTTDFVYLGDCAADLPIWKESIGAIVIGTDPAVLKALAQSGIKVFGRFPQEGRSLSRIGRCIRVHQWPKNLLVFLPIFLGHRVRDAGAWKYALLTLFAFCLTASFTYVWNDLLDLEADRQHFEKRRRPFASGDLSIRTGLLLLLGLGFSGLLVTSLMPVPAQLWIAAYLVMGFLYSFHLKTRLLADVVSLAILYAIRVMAGGAATGIVISPWTIAFCLFLFYSLALVKRFGELRTLPEQHSVPGRRGYRKQDLPVIAALGTASGILSVVVFALYISSPEVRGHYRAPAYLWLACPVILYWFGRIWILANRGDVAEDPLIFSLKDKASYLAGACIALIWLAASVLAAD